MTPSVGCATAGRNDRLFYTGMSIASIITVFVGFAPTYYLKGYFGAAPLSPLVHMHGLVFTSWILLFFAQNVLIASHQIGIHRRLGVAGAGLAALLVVVGLTTAVAFARRTVATGGAGTLAFLAIPFGDMLVFAILASAGILYRRRPETHKRLMLIATINILGAAISRWPLAIMKTGPMPFFVATDLFVLAGVCYDLASRRHVHAAYVWGGLLLLISQPVRLAVGHTDMWLALVGTLVQVEDSAPRFEITPNRVLCDEPVKAYLLNLKPNQQVTVRASAGILKSELEFTADAQGKVDLGGPEPDVSRAEKVAPLRIVWSMKMDPDARKDVPKRGAPDSIKVTFSAFVHGKEIANGSFAQLYVSPDVERIPVNERGLRGVFFRPKARGRYAGLLLLSGSEGGLNERRAGLLASHGYAVLALAYFDYEDLPKQMVEIPLEYFETGLQWLQKHESVQGDKLAVIGGSRGGELGLLLGARFPQITAVVGYVPSHVVWPESTDPRVVQRAAWTYKGKPVPDMGSAQVDRGEVTKVLNANPEVKAIAPIFQLYLKDAEAVRRAAIPVEKIRGPVLLVTGKEDQVWPAAQMADLVMQRLAEYKHPYPDQHLCYANCGHAIGIPNTPIGETRGRNRVGEVFELGGTPQGSGYAAWDSWPRVLKFLEENLKGKK